MTEKEIEIVGREIELIKSKWICFRVHSHTGKTFRIAVWTMDLQIMLGEIKWFSHWRKYAFYPLSGTVFEWECQRDIANVCEKMTKYHKSRIQMEDEVKDIVITSTLVDKLNSISQDIKFYINGHHWPDFPNESKMNQEEINELISIRKSIKNLSKRLRIRCNIHG